ncbi:hypothetical protein HELRODRAFT_170744 [Helobdella robusta]|uniref:Uncharacterized protein n=1 Tax=Helobdella robusta TaxID=6412 RepID=T1F3D8_HELRO|nr:hypothetical protein HELRODRAFT_170744 [Helobdella robusta]ESO07410.1 hypothetical protein HELRODRAFT_170744 [Helobdella robusta]
MKKHPPPCFNNTWTPMEEQTKEELYGVFRCPYSKVFLYWWFVDLEFTFESRATCTGPASQGLGSVGKLKCILTGNAGRYANIKKASITLRRGDVVLGSKDFFHKLERNENMFIIIDAEAPAAFDKVKDNISCEVFVLKVVDGLNFTFTKTTYTKLIYFC